MLEPAAFVVALSAVALTSVLVAAALRLDSIVSFLLAADLVASAEVVLLTLVLSPFRLVRTSAYAAGAAVLLAAALAAWSLRGRSRPPPLPPPALRAAVRAHPVLAALAVVVAREPATSSSSCSRRRRTRATRSPTT